MISLGEFQGYTLAVNQSNVEPSKVTFHLYKDGQEQGFSREDAFGKNSAFGEDPEDYLYTEAASRYHALGRPDAGDFDPKFKG